jgi:3-hydroxyacyl-[acyl-carrier-protein] dehydratase
MLLLNDFFTIEDLKKEAEGFVAKIQLKKDHKIYEGHFPGNPVVPGVCMVQIIKELLEKELSQSLRLTKADNIKFMNFVNPLEQDVLFFTLTYKKDQNIQAKATVSFEEKIFLKFGGSFQ